MFGYCQTGFFWFSVRITSKRLLWLEVRQIVLTVYDAMQYNAAQWNANRIKKKQIQYTGNVIQDNKIHTLIAQTKMFERFAIRAIHIILICLEINYILCLLSTSSFFKKIILVYEELSFIAQKNKYACIVCKNSKP